MQRQYGVLRDIGSGNTITKPLEISKSNHDHMATLDKKLYDTHQGSAECSACVCFPCKPKLQMRAPHKAKIYVHLVY